MLSQVTHDPPSLPELLSAGCSEVSKVMPHFNNIINLSTQRCLFTLKEDQVAVTAAEETIGAKSGVIHVQIEIDLSTTQRKDLWTELGRQQWIRRPSRTDHNRLKQLDFKPLFTLHKIWTSNTWMKLYKKIHIQNCILYYYSFIWSSLKKFYNLIDLMSH